MSQRIDGGVCAPQGFAAAGVACGIKESGKDDLALIVSDRPASAAGLFTTNRVTAWCVQHDRLRLARSRSGARAIVCNAGNANACNGDGGRDDDLRMASAAAERLGADPRFVLTASTGVIGRRLPMDRLLAGIDLAADALAATPEAAAAAARAILTTDLVTKECAVEFPLGGRIARIGGVAKGSGMIAPNLATMLGFLTTDVAADPAVLQAALARAVEVSFNRVTVDGDTSTNDMVLLLANGASGARAEDDLPAFEAALAAVCTDLARRIARDGEGATKLVAVTVTGAPDEAARIARTIAESPLVKTALFGNDPNWGRVLAAAGRAGVAFDPQRASVTLAGDLVYRGGEPTGFDEALVSEAMQTDELEIVVDLGDPAGETATVWTCDFSYDYVRINAEYTT